MNALLANPGFETALVTLMLGIAGYIQLRTKVAAQGGKLEGVQAAATAPATVVTVPAGGGAMAAAGGAAAPIGPHGSVITLPAWDQTTDIGVGGVSATGPIDCGPECVAMCLRVMTGVMVPAAYLRWLAKGPGDSSLTTADDLVQMFTINEHQAHRRDAPAEDLPNELGNAVKAGKPAIVLGRWLGPTGHWMACEGTDAQKGVLFRDPYGGPQYWVAWERVRSQYQGSYVHVDERATYAA